MGSPQFCHITIQTSFGEMFLVLSTGSSAGTPVARLHLPGLLSDMKSVTEFKLPGCTNDAKDEVSHLALLLQRFLKGEEVHLPTDVLDMSGLSPFQKRVLMAESRVPRGRVTSYGQLAESVECPGGARAVAGALATNPFPLFIPCHRTVRSNGDPGGYQGGGAMKRTLLEMEGVGFDEKGVIRMSRFEFRFPANQHLCH